jgi:hypothetical protein
MENVIFIIALTGLIIPFLWWCFKELPSEKWQILAAVPVKKADGHHWAGTNYTFYGFFVATAQSFAVAMTLVLTMSIGVAFGSMALAIVVTLIVSLPSSRLVALFVEKRRHTFTVAGAVFIGLILAPFVLIFLNACGFVLPVMPVMAALSVAYSFGEGIGRIACISFGCCYGKPVCTIGRLGRAFFRRMHFVFTGPTKKVAYEGGLESREVVPVQAITAVICNATGIMATCLFLAAAYRLSFILAMVITQTWRCYSETLRADYRGEYRVSVYQIMAAVSILYVLGMAWFSGPYRGGELPQIMRGLRAMANALPVLFVQAVWLTVFMFFGKSTVTRAEISFHVNRGAV